MKIEKILDQLSKLAIREVESETLSQPLTTSYAELVETIIRELDPSEISEEKLKVIRNAIVVLIQRRLLKILQKISEGEDIPRKLLYTEERKIVSIFEKLSFEKLREAKKTQQPQEAAPSSSTEGLAIVVFKDMFPALHSTLMLTLGPFSKFDVVSLPPDDANELKRKGIVDVHHLQ